MFVLTLSLQQWFTKTDVVLLHWSELLLTSVFAFIAVAPEHTGTHV